MECRIEFSLYERNRWLSHIAPSLLQLHSRYTSTQNPLSYSDLYSLFPRRLLSRNLPSRVTLSRDQLSYQGDPVPQHVADPNTGCAFSRAHVQIVYVAQPRNASFASAW